MNLKKVVAWLVVAFVVFYVIQAPEARPRSSATSVPRSVTRRPPSRPSSVRWSDPGMTGAAPGRLPTRASKDIAKYLLDDEEPVLTRRRHWAVLIEPTAKFLPAFVARRMCCSWSTPATR